MLTFWSVMGFAFTSGAQTAPRPSDSASAPRTQAQPAETPIPALNTRLLQFCKVRLGQTVGSGECADLVEQGIEAIGAHPRGADYPNSGDYVWGVLVCSVQAINGQHITEIGAAGDNGKVKPGDVIQFRDALFQGRIPHGTYWVRLDHHTAVVEKVSDDGASCQVLEQNSNGRRYVIESTLNIPDLRAGWLRVYRPAPLVEAAAAPEAADPAPAAEDKPATTKKATLKSSKAIKRKPGKAVAKRHAAKSHHKQKSRNLAHQ